MISLLNCRLPLLIVFATALVGCSARPVADSSSNNAKSKTITSSTPPFTTKEPNRYKATRVITTSERVAGTNDAPIHSRTSTTWIARDGANRREEYETEQGERVVYLENERGRFVLVPSLKSYADLDAAKSGAEQSPLPGTDEPITELLIGAQGESTYEELGPEQLGDRETRKYRVNSSDSSSVYKQETLIWVDGTFGMPIRSEARYEDSAHSSSVTMEIREISQEVDTTVFNLPSDYQRLDYSQIMAKMRSNRNK